MQVASLLVIALLGVALAWNPKNTTCTIKANATDTDVQNALTWVCANGGIDCTEIQPGGAHYYPDTLLAHMNWAANAYFQLPTNNDSASSCDFGGIAELSCGPRDWKRIRGVDIGGFLVLEPWITPSLFQQFVNKSADETAVDEYTFCSILGTEEATEQLTNHWNNWVQESDIQLLASFGLNTLRIPVGHWVFGDVPPYIGGIDQLDRVIGYATTYNLDVIVDLHGAPGSQNGFDNSGLTCGPCAGVCPKNFTWAINATAIDRTVSVIGQLAARYASNPTVVAIELLNEPRWDVNITTIKDYYLRAAAAVKAAAPNMGLVIHDAFRYNAWQGFMQPEAGFDNVILDTHIYQAFVQSDITNTPDGHLAEACGYSHMVDLMECTELPVIVGEWSLATSDCTEYLRGFEVPPLAPTYGVPCPHNQTDEFYTAFAASQLNTYERGHGWIFWNFKTESSPEWSYIDAVANGWMPSDVSTMPGYVSGICALDTP